MLPPNEQAAAEAALNALKNAYAPFSGYRTGAALITDSGGIITGCNVENRSFGLTVCAERTALFNAVSRGFHRFTALAVAADGEALPIPCGACLQVLSEFCGPDLPVYVLTVTRPEPATYTLGSLLPHLFHL